MLTFVREGQDLLDLQERALSAGQAKRDEEGQGALELGLTCVDQLGSSFAHLTPDLRERLTLVAVEQPGIPGLKNYMFFNYLSPGHPAIKDFSKIARKKRQLQKTLVLDWDWDPRNYLGDTSASRQELVLDGIHYDYPLQWLFYNSIGANFHRNNSMFLQEAIANGDLSLIHI